MEYKSSKFRYVIEQEIRENHGNYMILTSPEYKNMIMRTEVIYSPTSNRGTVTYLDAAEHIMAQFKGDVDSPEVPKLGDVVRKSSFAESQKKYNETKCQNYHIRFNKFDDADVIAKLESVENKNDYIRTLIRENIGK